MGNKTIYDWSFITADQRKKTFVNNNFPNPPLGNELLMWAVRRFYIAFIFIG